jgi:hypothetical protein
MTDSKRLDFVLAHRPEFDNHWREGYYSMVWYEGDHHWITRGKDMRECIDQALEGEGRIV